MPLGTNILFKKQCQNHMMTSLQGKLSALLALCEKNPLVNSSFPSKMVNDAGLWYFFAVNVNMLLSKHSSHRWFQKPWRSCKVTVMVRDITVVRVSNWGIRWRLRVLNNVDPESMPEGTTFSARSKPKPFKSSCAVFDNTFSPILILWFTHSGIQYLLFIFQLRSAKPY